MKTRNRPILFLFLITLLPVFMQARETPVLKTVDKAFFVTDEAKRIGDQVLAYQRVTGGWPKNTDMARTLSQRELDSLGVERKRMDDSTVDNDATTTPIRFLARLYAATGDERYRDAVKAGIEYLLSGQYDNGGWPQFWPAPQGYQVHITFNDGSMTNVMSLLRELSLKAEPFDIDIVDDATRQKGEVAFKKGVECILACQIMRDGKPTVWCQQHDRETYAPASARTYELPSFCTQESARIISLLMDIPDPDERIISSVKGAMEWLENHKMMGYRHERIKDPATGKFRASLMSDENAGPIWGRFYDLEEEKVFVCDRDGIPRRSLDEIGEERRNGYSWYNDHAAQIQPKYEEWLRAINN